MLKEKPKEYWYVIKNCRFELLVIIFLTAPFYSLIEFDESIAITLFSVGITLILTIINGESQNNRWLMNKMVDVLENIISESESYKDLLTEYLEGSGKIENLIGDHRVDLIVTFNTDMELIANYKKLIKAEKGEKLFHDIKGNYKKLESEIKELDMANTKCKNNALIKNMIDYLNKIISDSSKLIIKSPHIIAK